MAEVFSVVRSHPRMSEYVRQLQSENSDIVPYFVNYELNNIFLGILRGKPWGFFDVGIPRHKKGEKPLGIHATCIKYGKASIKYGKKLIEAIEEYARSVSSSEIVVKVPSDILDADEFWKGVGFSCVAVKDGGRSRSRKLNIWVKPLKKFLFETGSITPVHSKIKRVRNKKKQDTPPKEDTVEKLVF